MRTFRHNREASRNAGPDVCLDCEEWSATYVVHISYDNGRQSDRWVCDECLYGLLPKLANKPCVFRIERWDSPPS